MPRLAPLRHLGARLGGSLAILFALSFALFGVLSALPGDPVDLLVTADPSVRPDDVARLKALRGLDRPWPVQWARWLFGHPEPVEPPHAPAGDTVVLELAGGRGERVDLRGKSVDVESPGVYDEPFVVKDPATGLEDVGADHIFASPPISAIPPRPEGAPLELDEAERELGGSLEGGRASDAELVAAAEKAGRALRVPPPFVVDAAADGSAVVPAARLCPAPDAALWFVDGPGTVDAAGWRARFEGPGRSAVLYTCARGAVTARGAFVVEHGVVTDPHRFHRGALFALLGDGQALGWSSAEHRPVVELLRGRVGNTLLLMVPAFLLALAAAVPLGALAASRKGSLVDRGLVVASIAAVSVPAFWLGLMAVVVFAAKLRWLPSAGMSTPGASGAVDVVRHAVLPIAVLTVAYAAPFFRFVRAGVLEALPLDFVRTARAKGLSPNAVLARHVLRHALFPLVTVAALEAPQMFAGALLTETVFAWPGVGRLLYDSILENDSYVAVVVCLVTAALVLACNGAADVLAAVLDPRVRRR